MNYIYDCPHLSQPIPQLRPEEADVEGREDGGGGVGEERWKAEAQP